MRLARFAVLFCMLNAIGFLIVALMALTAHASGQKSRRYRGRSCWH